MQPREGKSRTPRGGKSPSQPNVSSAMHGDLGNSIPRNNLETDSAGVGIGVGQSFPLGAGTIPLQPGSVQGALYHGRITSQGKATLWGALMGN